MDWREGRIRMVAGPQLIQSHKERVIAKDAWLTHQEAKSRSEN